MKHATKRWNSMLVAIALASVGMAFAPIAKADVATVLEGTIIDGVYTVNSPWGANVGVIVRFGRVRSANGVLGKTAICYQNKTTGDVAVGYPSQTTAAVLTRNVRLNGTSRADSFRVRMYDGRNDDETGFCSSGAGGLFAGLTIENGDANEKLIYIDARSGNDTIDAFADKVSAILGAGDDSATIYPRSHMYVDANDGSAGIDDVYSKSPTFDGEVLNVGNGAHDCMTDYSAEIHQLWCGNPGDFVFLTSPLVANVVIGDGQNKFCQPRIANQPDKCSDILDQFR